MKDKHYYIEFNNGSIVSYKTAKTLKQAIKKAREEFPEHFVVTKSGEVNI